jgi:hypothetical protein
MRQVGVDRAYRVVAVLEQTANDIEMRIIPQLQALLGQWRRRVLWMDGIVFGVIMIAIVAWTLWTGQWNGLSFLHPTWQNLLNTPVWRWVFLGVVVVLALYTHFTLRQLAAKRLMAKLRKQVQDMRDRDFVEGIIQAFHKNTRPWHSIFHKQPTGWGPRSRRQVSDVLAEANSYVQDLNDKFTNPAGTEKASPDTDDKATAAAKVTA